MPKISVIIPVYNAAAVIEDTIMSVLEQSYEDHELILVDDASSDNSRQVIEDHLCDRIKLLDNRHEKGAAGARNTGIEAATGRYIAFIDADDKWMKEKLARQIAFMKEKDAAFSFTGYEFADESGVGNGKIVHPPKTLSYKEALGNTTIFTSTVLFDMDKLPKEKLMMPKIKSEDTALWWRILREGEIAYGLDENLVIYRRPGKSLSSNKLEAVRRIWNLYRKAEGLSVFKSCYYFVRWGYNAVARRV